MGLDEHPSKFSPLDSVIPSKQQPYLDASQLQFLVSSRAGVFLSPQHPY